MPGCPSPGSSACRAMADTQPFEQRDPEAIRAHLELPRAPVPCFSRSSTSSSPHRTPPPPVVRLWAVSLRVRRVRRVDSLRSVRTAALCSVWRSHSDLMPRRNFLDRRLRAPARITSASRRAAGTRRRRCLGTHCRRRLAGARRDRGGARSRYARDHVTRYSLTLGGLWRCAMRAIRSHSFSSTPSHALGAPPDRRPRADCPK